MHYNEQCIMIVLSMHNSYENMHYLSFTKNLVCGNISLMALTILMFSDLRLVHYHFI